MRKLTTQEFIEKARLVHGDKYDYSKVNYVGKDRYVTIICPIHGDFQQTPHGHTNGKVGCRLCGKGKIIEVYNTKSFIEKARLVHGDKYDYSESVYFGSNEKVTIICPIHGKFQQTPHSHVHNTCNGCPVCGRLKSGSQRRFTKEQFIEKARLAHGDKYDYSKVEYNGSDKNVIIICPIHGEFEQRAISHLISTDGGCKLCANNKFSELYTYTLNQFVEKARQVHDDKYDYSKVDYKSMKDKIVISCPDHGDFEQSPYKHLFGQDCPVCGRLKRDRSYTYTTEEFVEKSRLVHGDKYDYSKVDYKLIKEKVTIVCPVHGKFEQVPDNHIHGQGCPNCSHRISTGEQEVIDYIKSLISDEVQTSTRQEFMFGLELDIYIPQRSIAIEYDGLYFHCELFRKEDYHLEKTILCESAKVHLIHIFEDEWLHKKEIVKSRLKNLFGLTGHKVYARKCKVVDLTNYRTTVNHFLNNNHIQGSTSGYEYAFGLEYNDDIVSVMTFNNPRIGIGAKTNEKDNFELSRFCSIKDYNVVGGASKLLSHFIKTFDPSVVVSYADRRWSYEKSNVYERLGFHNKTINPISYSYIVEGTHRKHRSGFTKYKLIEKYGCSPEDTEHNFCFNKGIYRIYDCGTITYKMIRL